MVLITVFMMLYPLQSLANRSAGVVQYFVVYAAYGVFLLIRSVSFT